MALTLKERRALRAEFFGNLEKLPSLKITERRPVKKRMLDILDILNGVAPAGNPTPTYDALKRGDYDHATPDAFRDAIMKAAGELGIGEMDDPKDLTAISQNWAMINYGNAA